MCKVLIVGKGSHFMFPLAGMTVFHDHVSIW